MSCYKWRPTVCLKPQQKTPMDVLLWLKEEHLLNILYVLGFRKKALDCMNSWRSPQLFRQSSQIFNAELGLKKTKRKTSTNPPPPLKDYLFLCPYCKYLLTAGNKTTLFFSCRERWVWIFQDRFLISWPKARVGSMLTAAQHPKLIAALRSYAKCLCECPPIWRRLLLRESFPTWPEFRGKCSFAHLSMISSPIFNLWKHEDGHITFFYKTD